MMTLTEYTAEANRYMEVFTPNPVNDSSDNMVGEEFTPLPEVFYKYYMNLGISPKECAELLNDDIGY